MIDYSRKSHSVAFTKLESRCVILNSVNKQVSTVYYTSSVSVISCGCATQGTIYTHRHRSTQQTTQFTVRLLVESGTLAKAVTQSAGGATRSGMTQSVLHRDWSVRLSWARLILSPLCCRPILWVQVRRFSTVSSETEICIPQHRSCHKLSRTFSYF